MVVSGVVDWGLFRLRIKVREFLSKLRVLPEFFPADATF